MSWRLHPYRLPLARRYAWARGMQTERVGALLSMDSGWGEIAYAPDAPFNRQHVEATLRSAEVDGKLRPDDIQDPRIRCGAATARLDARARRDGISLAATLADVASRPPRPSVAVNALITGDDIQAQVAQAASQGIDVFKIKCSADRERDVARITALRDAAPGATIRLDANGSWSADWALEHMHDLGVLHIDYVEQPLQPGDVGDIARLAANAPFAVALDEAATDAPTIARLLEAGAGSVVILKPQRLGGPDRLVEAMRMAHDAGARTVVTNSLETSVGVHAALHCASLLPTDEACGLATSHFLARDVGPAPIIEAGRMRVPTQPGLGIDPVPDAPGSRGHRQEPA